MNRLKNKRYKARALSLKGIKLNRVCLNINQRQSESDLAKRKGYRQAQQCSLKI